MAAAEDHATRFRALVVPELAYLHRLARALVADRHAAEDLVQDSVVRGLRYFESYGGDSFRAWMATIMRNLHHDRRAASGASLDEEAAGRVADPAPDPEERVVAADRAAQLRAAIARLPDPLREVLVLREFGELSYTQIADALAVPKGTVMSRLARARDALRQQWRAEHEEIAS